MNRLNIHGAALTDKHIMFGRMKDDYPIELFQIKNVLNEFLE